jgi:sugar/nucleoside kinase (ribokinase family)
MRTGVVVIGDALLDVSVHPVTAPVPGSDVPADVRLGPGGQGANVAVRLSRRGITVRLACAIGDDVAGRIVRDGLEADGVEVHDLGATRTGTVVVTVEPAGERTMLSQRSPILEGRVFDPGPLFDGQWVIVSGYALLEPSAGLSASGATPIRVVLGCAVDARHADDWVRAASSLTPHLVIVNIDEATVLAGDIEPPAALASRLAGRFGSLVVVTHRAGAAAAIGQGRPVEVVGAVPDGPAVDTTGAGDAFAAALVAELSEARWPPSAVELEAAMAEGLALASAVTRVRGAQGRVSGEPAR